MAEKSLANEQPLGIVTGKAEPHRLSFLASRPVHVGEYIEVEGPQGRLLGLVERSIVQSSLLDSVENYQAAMEARSVASKNPRDKMYLGGVRVLGLVEDLRVGNVYLPSVAPLPGSEVREAPKSVLRSVFSKDGIEWAKVGTLARSKEVEVSVNIDKVASRHLAILAATGAGKSNLLALLTKRFSDVRGTMVIFDYHGEYSELNVPTVVHVPAKINPRHVDSDKLADLLDVRENATIQRSVLHEAFTDEVKLSTEFWNALLAAVMEIAKNNKDAKKRAAERVYDIIGTSMRRMRRVLDPDIANPLDQIKPNHVNVLNMLELTERQAGIVIAHNLEELLEDRKRARQSRWAKREEGIKAKFMAPVVCAIEEAHAFIPNNEDTEAKYVASKVAREGRKFGLSLIIVSQRPSRVDQDVLSQMSSLAVLRISQPQDQDYIVDASEIVSKELAAYLPSLNVGEAILLGQWVNLPSVTKIQRVEEKLMGADISAVREWSENVELAKVAKEKTSDLIRDM